MVDVVPFVAAGSDRRSPRRPWPPAIASPAGPPTSWACPASCYGPERTLPEVRRGAFTSLRARHRARPSPIPTAGAIAVGARPVLVAYNLWLAEPDLDEARRIARGVRSDAVRALGLAVGDRRCRCR